MRLLSILVGLAIAIGNGFALTNMPWSIETVCAKTGDDQVRCTVATHYPLRDETLTLGPGAQVEAGATPTGDQDKAFRPQLRVGKDRLDLPILVDTHKDAMERAHRHATIGPPVSMPIAKGRHALVGGFAALGLLLVVSSLRKKK